MNDSEKSEISQGTSDSAAFDRLKAGFLMLRADIKDMTEEVLQMRRAITKETLVLEK